MDRLSVLFLTPSISITVLSGLQVGMHPCFVFLKRPKNWPQLVHIVPLTNSLTNVSLGHSLDSTLSWTFLPSPPIAFTDRLHTLWKQEAPLHRPTGPPLLPIVLVTRGRTLQTRLNLVTVRVPATGTSHYSISFRPPYHTSSHPNHRYCYVEHPRKEKSPTL